MLKIILRLIGATNAANSIIGLKTAENHSLRDCKATEEQYKCINCTNFNKYNQKSSVNTKHSSLDKNCSCYLNALRRFTETIDY
jgi:hypothetical protein